MAKAATANPVKPSLFGITHSNRDFADPESWGKNKFNSSFPAALIAYMESQKIPLVYLTLDKKGEIQKKRISGKQLFGMEPTSKDLYYAFESSYTPFQPFCIGDPPKVDLMLMDQKAGRINAGYEIKLTTIPDNTTCDLTDDKQGCEIVIRGPSMHFLACSLASIYHGHHEDLRTYFGEKGFGNPASYVESAQINPRITDIWERMDRLVQDNLDNQSPAIIQPVWKTIGKSSKLADNCLDVFVWSNLAFTRLFMTEATKTSPTDITRSVSRPTRALITLFFMLNEVSVRGTFDQNEIFKKLTYDPKNDKALSVTGNRMNRLMTCPELTNPRVTKKEIKNIILGGGQKLLSPERRFDAVLVNSPELFD